MHAEDMADIGVADGTTTELTSSAGSLSLPARPRTSVARRTVVVPHGVPGLNVNCLIPSGQHAIERLSGQHIMTGIAVELSPRSEATVAAEHEPSARRPL